MTVFSKMKFTIRILSKEKLGLQASLRIQTGVVALESREGKGGVHQTPGKEVGKKQGSGCGQWGAGYFVPMVVICFLWRMKSLAQL